LPAALNDLKLVVDNTPPDVSIGDILHGASTVQACEIVKTPPNSFQFKINASDPSGHLYSVGLSAMYGDNKTCSIYTDSYETHDPTPEVPLPAPGKHAGAGPAWTGLSNQTEPVTAWSPLCNCAYTFYLGVWKRTIDGWNWIMYRDYHKSITIEMPAPAGVCSSAAGCTP
jgi:hypothetical protein